MSRTTRLLADSLKARILSSLLCSGCLVGCDADVRRAGGSPDGSGGESGTGAASSTGGQGGQGGGVGAAGGTAGAGGSGGSFYTDCTDNGIGECCSYTLCFTHAQIAPFANEPDAPACPGFQDLQPTGFCDWFTAGPVSEGPDECCYDMRGGTCCGRPFLVAGSDRRASAIEREDWRSDSPPEDIAPSVLRSRLADAWLEDALMEHASLAAFARFTLQLLHVGAPPDLVAASQRSALDELEHAKACFGLASRYAGKPLGPGALSIDGAFTAETISEIVINTFHEGCVGETVASLLAAEQVDGVEDPYARTVLERVARDEAAHAELAWRFVGWALNEHGDAVRSALHQALAQAMSAEPVIHGHDLDEDPAWRAAGRLSATQKRAVWQSAMKRVVAPCAMALLVGSGDAPGRSTNEPLVVL